MEKMIFQVTGMHCAGCAANVERSVKKLSGVSEVYVSIGSRTMELQRDPSVVTTEEILEAEELCPQGALKIAILEEDDVAVFAENQYAIRDALCLWSDVPELLEQALRVYQGRAFWDGTGDLEPEFLAEMAKKYGLVLL